MGEGPGFSLSRGKKTEFMVYLIHNFEVANEETLPMRGKRENEPSMFNT